MFLYPLGGQVLGGGFASAGGTATVLLLSPSGVDIMPLKNQSLVIAYTAWNTATQQGQPGDGANHVLKVVVDGVEQAVAGTPAEVDPTNAPGEYSVTLTSGNMNGNFVKFCGVSSTGGVIIVPVPMATDRGNLDVAVSTRLATSSYAAAPAVAVDGSGRVALQPSGLDAIPVEAGVNARQALSPILAAAAGVLSGATASGGTVTIRGGNVSTTRITATTDADGNRTSVVLVLPT